VLSRQSGVTIVPGEGGYISKLKAYLPLLPIKKPYKELPILISQNRWFGIRNGKRVSLWVERLGHGDCLY